MRDFRSAGQAYASSSTFFSQLPKGPSNTPSIIPNYPPFFPGFLVLTHTALSALFPPINGDSKPNFRDSMQSCRRTGSTAVSESIMRDVGSFCYLLFLFRVALFYQGPSSRLTRHLLAQHDKNAPPDGVVVVKYDMELVNIIHIDELQQHMRVLVYIVEEWTDSTLSWDPAAFSGLNVTWLPEEALWLPDIIVFNMLEHDELLKSVRSPIKVFHSGKVIYSFPAIYAVMCHISVGRFPFDDQKCELRVASWEYPEDKLLLRASNAFESEHYSTNEEWDLLNVGLAEDHYSHETTTVSSARFVVEVRRKPFYYLFSLVLPTYIICMLSISGLFARFSTKHERQERFTLGVTSILSMAVLSLVVTEKVPHSSEEVPLLVVYFHFNMVVVTIATVLTSTVMRVHIKGFHHDSAPPRWMCRVLLLKEKKRVPEDKNELGAGFLHRHVISEQWGEISRRMDYLLMFAFLVVVTTPTVYLFLLCQRMDRQQAANGSNETAQLI